MLLPLFAGLPKLILLLHNRVPEECPQATADVVEQCLHEDADVRPSAREIVDKLSQLRELSQT